MQKLLYLTTITLILLIGCSKKSDNPQPANSVIIKGSTYSTVKIGSQTWTSINYNGSGGVNYNNSSVNDPVYGKLYTYIEAEAISLPTGWRLPTQNDFTTLLITMGATAYNGYYSLQDTLGIKLLSKTTWSNGRGTNTMGFNAVASGLFSINGGFRNLGYMTNLLTSSKFPDGENMSLQIFQTSSFASSQIFTGLNDVIPNATDRGSVRFVKDN